MQTKIFSHYILIDTDFFITLSIHLISDKKGIQTAVIESVTMPFAIKN